MSSWNDPRSPWLPPPTGAPAGRPAPAGPATMRPPDDPGSERLARLTITLLAVSVAVLVIGLVVFFTVRTLRQDDAPSPVLEGPPATTPEDAARVVGGIGPPPGADVVTYVDSRRAALAAVTDDRLAVVSFNAYTTEAKARATVAEAEVVALLAAAPGGQPAVVTGDLGTWARSQTADARAERDEIQRLIPTAQNDPAFQAFYREEVERLNKMINAIRPDGNLVFAAVVRGPGPTLQQLAAKPEVRLVDVGASADPGPRPEYRGLRPEEASKANEPNTRPA